jgi:hypothetical protein
MNNNKHDTEYSSWSASHSNRAPTNYVYLCPKIGNSLPQQINIRGVHYADKYYLCFHKRKTGYSVARFGERKDNFLF